MAESSSSRITITLGRSGQVVKRAGPVSDHPFPDLGPSVGSKRSVRDRLGSVGDSTTEFNNKRQRGDGSRLGSSASSGIDDGRLAKDDLRYKIMRKTALDRGQNNGQQRGVDLRDFLSRPAQSSTAKPSSRQHIPDQRDNRPRVPEPRDSRSRVPEPRDSRSRVPEPRDSRPRVPEPRDSRPRVPESRDSRPQIPDDRKRMLDSRGSRQYLHETVDSREYMPEARDSRGHRPELKDVRYITPESRSLSILGRAPSTRNADALPPMDSVRNSYSPWTLDRLRRRSPDGVLSSRGISPPRRGEELQRRPPVTPYDDPRLSSYTRKGVSELSRPMSSAGYLSNSSQPAGPGKTVAPLHAPIPQSRSLVQKSSYAVEDQPTVDSFLQSLGLEKYAIHFKAEEVDLYSLKQMGDNDLKELGVPMGPRKKILLALAARARRQV